MLGRAAMLGYSCRLISVTCSSRRFEQAFQLVWAGLSFDGIGLRNAGQGGHAGVLVPLDFRNLFE